MALAAASLPRSAEDIISEKSSNNISGNEQQRQQAATAKVLINPIAAYSQQLADKQLHIARVTDDGVHWRRKEAAGVSAEAHSNGNTDASSKRNGGYFKDRVLSKLNKSSNTALSGGMLDREFSDDEYAAAAARLDVGDTSKLDDGRAYGARVPSVNSCMHTVVPHSKINGHSADDDGSTRSTTPTPSTSKLPNGKIATPSDGMLTAEAATPIQASHQSRSPSLLESLSEAPSLASDLPSRYGTPVATLDAPPSPLMGYHTPTEELPTFNQGVDATNPQTTSSLESQYEAKSAGVPARAAVEPQTQPGTSAAFPFARSSSTDAGSRTADDDSNTNTRQQQDKPAPLPLSALPFLPQANIIPPTPPTASTSASFGQQASTSALPDTEDAQIASSSSQQAKQSSQHPHQQAPSSPKSPRTPSSPASSSQPPLYLSPESIRKTSPSHKRSQSYQASSVPPRGSISSGSGPGSSGPPLATPGLSSSSGARRSSLLPPITTTAINLGSDAALRKRSLSPRRALSFRGSGSGTALPTPGGILFDEPMSIEEQEQQQRTADQLDETIARQAEQIRKERLSKRIETQRAHEKALASLREEEEARKGRGEDTGASALLQGSPPGKDGLPSPMATAAAGKGKDRERGDTSSTTHTAGQASPTSPVSVHKQLWSSSPVAGEKAVLRGADSNVLEKAPAAMKEKIEEQPERVLVGNLIGEDHVNYVLMYNMLTGIRIGVSRCEAKNHRPLTDADYTAQHKFSFDIVGNELTPSARYDFKFKDYAPWVFRELRAHFHLDPADYLLSLTAKYILSELGSPGKSGSFFYFSRDYRFIIKTISHTEHKFLRKILKEYHKHVLDNPNTLISRFYGLHRVKLPHGRKIHFVIMNNLFPPHRDIHETFDLKGSSIGREYPEDLAAKKPRATLKDLNWVHRHRQIDFGPYKRTLFEEQLKRDVELLQRLRIMDYSLLIGIHDMGRGNKENLRDGMLTVFSPEGGQGGKLRRRPTHRGDLEREHTAAELRKAVQRADPQVLSNGTYQLPQKDQSERKYFVFYQDEGGIRATDEYDQNENKIYYLGVIDILTPYNWKKCIEHAWRSMQYDKHRISAVPPKEYGDRFLAFLISSIRGGDQSKRPKME